MWTKPLLPAPPWHRAGLILSLLGVCFSLSIWTGNALRHSRLVAVDATVPYRPVAEPPDEALASLRVPKLFSLSRGQTVSGLLQEVGVASAEVRGAVLAMGEHLDLRRVRSGETGLAYYDAAGDFERLRLRLDRRGWLSLHRTTDGWRSSMREFVRTVETRHVEGRLDSFLFNDIEKAGAPPQLAVAMSRVLQWDLDFNRDLRRGDRFSVLYEEVSLDGQVEEVGQVLAMIYEGRGARHEAFLFTSGEEQGYYDGEGRPLQKMFLRSPLPFMRVTSKFSHRRLHPVLGTYRPHYGVDFGAPRGTPVRVTASGTVTFAARKGGAGNMVKVRHANGFQTLYLHLSKFGPGVRRGVRVVQGDVIGYVGSTGLSTGPHLDYRVQRGGRYLDPLKLENKPAQPISASRRLLFEQRRDSYLAQLGLSQEGVQLAAKGSGSPAGLGP